MSCFNQTGTGGWGRTCPYALPCGKTPCSMGQTCPGQYISPRPTPYWEQTPVWVVVDNGYDNRIIY